MVPRSEPSRPSSVMRPRPRRGDLGAAVAVEIDRRQPNDVGAAARLEDQLSGCVESQQLAGGGAHHDPLAPRAAEVDREHVRGPVVGRAGESGPPVGLVRREIGDLGAHI